MTTEYFFHFVLPFGVAMAISIVLIPLWIAVCRRWKLFDEPDSRKHHTSITPSMGGIAIFAGIYIAFIVFADILDHNKIRYLFGAVLILFFTGFFDDLMDIPPSKKMLLQAISTGIIYYGGFRITSLDGLLWIHEIPELIQLPLTLFVVILFTNAYNFIDGVDGLAGTLGVIITACIGALFFHYGKTDYAVLSFCATGSLLGFLFFNFAPAKIFMGDTGSLVVGFMIAVLSIELLNSGVAQPELAVSPVLLIAILFVPVYDISRVFVIRMLNGSSPFRADRNHMHHLMLGFGFGHRSVALMMASMCLLFAMIPQLLPFLPSNIILMILPILTYAIIHPKILGTFASVHHRIFGNQATSKSTDGLR
ncbi:MAG: undecaprenyl/decaprenyl-phosphate alpha-N-acetylglucosaminyl 1-phosphate transferase [Bacteroidota bacterium]|nr:undecaprenyl/decaprenyl-phosphate alpha-N-acetylglucosaminyl 1-phosphate transferase [Bacteroidota bacterium]